MLYDRLRVFVSSKMAELSAERAVIKEVLDEINVDAWVFEQDAGARTETIQETFQEQLEASDLYIGVFWKGYGDYTIEEFDQARATDTDCLIYQKQGDKAEGRDPRLQAFLERLGTVESGLTIQFFETPEELREMVKRDTARWQTRIVRKYRAGDRRSGKPPADPDLAVLLGKVRRFWVEGVLERSIADSGLVALDLERREDLVDPPVERTAVRAEVADAAPKGSGMAAAFERSGRSLLLLGRSGAGKTTSALEIVRGLVTAAERDDSRPIPLVLNLSAWTSDIRTFTSFMTRELSSKYQVPAASAVAWIERSRLVLILDGLDEVEAGNRADCVEAINRFTAEFELPGLVVTSRLDEYLALSPRLRLAEAVCLQPLEPDRVGSFLEAAGEPLAGLREALARDPALREMASTPLMLSVMATAYRGLAAEELEADSSESTETREARLFGTYVERAFRATTRGLAYSRTATRSWLSWLAKRMAERGATVFLIEELQPEWLARRAQRGVYLVGFALLFGLVLGGLCVLYRATPSALPDTLGVLALPSAREASAWLAACTYFLLVVGLVEGFERSRGRARGAAANLARVASRLALFGVLWLGITFLMVLALEPDPDFMIVRFVVPAAGLTMGATALAARRSLSRDIQTTERLGLEWAAARAGALRGLLVGVVFSVAALAAVAMRAQPGKAVEVLLASGGVVMLFWLFIGASLGALLAGLRPLMVRGKTVPNQGMRLTAGTALRAGSMALSIAAVIPLAALLFGEGPQRDPARVASWTISAAVFLFVSAALWFGALDLSKHILVRAVVAATRQGPWSFQRFLDDAARRNLIRPVGGGYMFLHRPLLDHFAALDLPPPLAEEIPSPEREQRAPTARLLVAMAVVAATGGVLLFVGLALDRAWTTALGTILLGIGGLWLVVRAAVLSAIRAGRSENDGA